MEIRQHAKINHYERILLDMVKMLREHTGLHCGERLEIEVDGVWLKTRMEMNPKRQWYLTDTPYCGNLENIQARVSRTLQEAR